MSTVFRTSDLLNWLCMNHPNWCGVSAADRNLLIFSNCVNESLVNEFIGIPSTRSWVVQASLVSPGNELVEACYLQFQSPWGELLGLGITDDLV